MTSSWKRTFLALGALIAALAGASVASGQTADEYGDYGDVSDVGPSDVVQTVARISHLQGDVSYARGDDPDDWQSADVNIPMTLGDRVYTARRSRLELQVHGGDVIWLGSRTDLAALNLTDDTKQFALKSGIGSFQVRRLDEDDVWEVDTPNAAVTFEQAGDYRVTVDPDGNTRVSVRQGSATVAAGGGQVALNSGEAIAIEGIDSPRYEVLSAAPADSWDRWVGTRSSRFRRSPSYHYVSADIVGVDDLDEYGSWQSIPEYGNVWSPTRVEVGWQPYRQGHWTWQDPWGWTWISVEPWGWAPYHYGRWVTYSSRWFWVPVAPAVRVVPYAPALVAFVGGGPNFSATVTIGGGGYVGWFPLAPRDPLIPWWAGRRTTNVNVTNVTYINQTYVTVVNHNTFVSGAVVSRNVVTDRTVVRQVASAQVYRGAVPVLPTTASIRVSTSQRAASRPPAAVQTRSVVARVAPPPAPPRFQQKLEVIRENRGAPVNQAAATRIVSQAQAAPRAVAAVRPVSTDRGVTLSPRSAPSSTSSATSRTQAAPKVAPVAPVRGRAIATTERPVASGPVVGNKSRAKAESGAPNRPAAAPQERPTVEREVAQPARPESRPEPQRAPGQPAPEAVRPTPVERIQRQAPESRPTVERETPERRPTVERERAPVPPQPNARPKPTPERETPDNRSQMGQRARPTPPEKETVQGNAPARERAQPAQEHQHVVTPPPSREVVRPANREHVTAARPDERKQPQSRTKPKPTPEKKDDKKSDRDPSN